MASNLVLVGFFSALVHGASTTNAAVRERLVELGANVTVLDTATPSLDRLVFRNLGRLPRVMDGLLRLAAQHHLHYQPLCPHRR